MGCWILKIKPKTQNNSLAFICKHFGLKIDTEFNESLYFICSKLIPLQFIFRPCHCTRNLISYAHFELGQTQTEQQKLCVCAQEWQSDRSERKQSELCSRRGAFAVFVRTLVGYQIFSLLRRLFGRSEKAILEQTIDGNFHRNELDNFRRKVDREK